MINVGNPSLGISYNFIPQVGADNNTLSYLNFYLRISTNTPVKVNILFSVMPKQNAATKSAMGEDSAMLPTTARGGFKAGIFYGSFRL
ncbi:MAG: hypothetical protein MRQ07_02695 [Candidatus Midichloria sp.]|nr:hypothetical protein [Candidatus Midichloria sp.]